MQLSWNETCLGIWRLGENLNFSHLLKTCKFICFVEVNFVIKKEFISDSLSGEKAARKEALWIFNLLNKAFLALIIFVRLG